MFSKFLHEINTPYKTCNYIDYFLYKMASFCLLFTQQSDQNVHQIALVFKVFCPLFCVQAIYPYFYLKL